jgi:glycosyltransferase involved in cell wall biosynthesis
VAVNIGITTYNRKDFLCDCIDSVLKNTIVPFNLFVYDDGSTDGTIDKLRDRYKGTGIISLRNNVRSGIVPGFNKLWEVSEAKNNNEYFCYLQDDTVVKPGWLKTLIGVYETQRFYSDYKVGLFSGHHAPEHPIEAKKEITGIDVYFKKSIRATNMIATYNFWDKIGKVPIKNPDGSSRGFPGPIKADGSRGKGSNMDVYITGHQSNGVYVPGAAGKTCSWNLGTYCMVVPGLVKHNAVDKKDSTWGNVNRECRAKGEE